MPLFYFDIQDSTGMHRDEFGDVFEDIAEARDQAQALLPDIARDEARDGGDYIVSCDVRDASGDVIYRAELTFRGLDCRGRSQRRWDGAAGWRDEIPEKRRASR